MGKTTHTQANTADEALCSTQGANLHLGLVHQTEYIMSRTFHVCVRTECSLIMSEIVGGKKNSLLLPLIKV